MNKLQIVSSNISAFCLATAFFFKVVYPRMFADIEFLSFMTNELVLSILCLVGMFFFLIMFGEEVRK